MNPYRDDPLYRELIPTRPTPPDPYRMEDGPSFLLMQLEREQALWAAAHEEAVA